MSDVYSTRFYASFLPAGSAPVVGPVPVGARWVLRDINIQRAALASSYVSINLGTVNGARLIFFPGDTGTSAHWDGRLVLLEGESFVIQVALGSVNISISGYQLGTVPG